MEKRRKMDWTLPIMCVVIQSVYGYEITMFVIQSNVNESNRFISVASSYGLFFIDRCLTFLAFAMYSPAWNSSFLPVSAHSLLCSTWFSTRSTNSPCLALMWSLEMMLMSLNCWRFQIHEMNCESTLPSRLWWVGFCEGGESWDWV